MMLKAKVKRAPPAIEPVMTSVNIGKRSVEVGKSGVVVVWQCVRGNASKWQDGIRRGAKTTPDLSRVFKNVAVICHSGVSLNAVP